MRVALVVPVFPQISETFIASKAVGLLDPLEGIET